MPLTSETPTLQAPPVSEVPAAPPMDRPPPISRTRLTAAILALIAIIIVGLIVPGGGSLRQAGVVQASRSFSVSALGNGRYQVALLDGSATGGPTAIREQVFRFDNSDLVELTVTEGLHSGDPITQGQLLAQIHSPQHQQRLVQLQAERDALAAQRQLLAAGGRPEEVRAARQAVQVAEARRAQTLAELERTRALARQGAISSANLEDAELQAQVRTTQVGLEQARARVARSSARPEALQDLDARVAAAEARVAELEALLERDQIRSPMDGVLQLGGAPDGQAGGVLQVDAIDPVYVRLPVPERVRGRLSVGTPVQLRTVGIPDHPFQGSVAVIGQDAAWVTDQAVFWATARVDNPDGLLRAGMTGEIRAPLKGERQGILSSLWGQVFGL